MKSGTENWRIGQYERRNGEFKERKIREEERRKITFRIIKEAEEDLTGSLRI